MMMSMYVCWDWRRRKTTGSVFSRRGTLRGCHKYIQSTHAYSTPPQATTTRRKKKFSVKERIIYANRVAGFCLAYIQCMYLSSFFLFGFKIGRKMMMMMLIIMITTCLTFLLLFRLPFSLKEYERRINTRVYT